jgi:hypothetical protein
MCQTQEIERFVIEQLPEVESYGFTAPIVSRNQWGTTIDWFHDGIALEVKLNWRDFDIYVLLVRLENGNLPAGNYVSNGQRCRFYLQRVIKERGWSVDQAALKRISPGAGYDSPDYSTAMIKEKLENYRKVLMSCIEQIVAEKDLIFQ